MRFGWLRVDSWGAIGEGDRSVASAEPSLRPSAERWPLCGAFLDAGLKPRST
jgi:hypothetical protein